MSKARVLSLAALTVCCLSGLENKAVTDWIKANAVVLEKVEAGSGFRDMQPLKNLIGNARIVALGEATHGTREFFQLKHRMLEFLATEMGFTIFSIEANMPEAYRLNEYVLTGAGDPAQLLRGMYFWTWDTEEVLEMIRWMREFNKSGKGRVEFTGFDMQTPGVAAGVVGNFVAKYEPEYAATVKEASALAQSAGQETGAAFGVATATFPVGSAAGKRIRFSGYIKTENVTSGYAGLWWRVDGPQGVLAFDNMGSRGVTGTQDWKRYEIELPVGENAKNINFGALFPGKGTAWFDSLEVQIDGRPYSAGATFDLGFESAPPRGFYTGGQGYRVELDKSVFHQGAQSLRMTSVENQPSISKTDSKAAAARWTEIVRHIDSAKTSYSERKAGKGEIEWALQNARVVQQAMQMRSNEVQRDASMALNVKWILDQSPKAKIVLWAHNGHVTTQRFGNFEAMGGALRRMYGDQMVTLGFAFNEGSFQAIERGKGLHDFTVGPAAGDSLDAMLASVQLPVFLIDLRRLPESGPVAEWFRQPHRTRSIGALYDEGSAERFYGEFTGRDCYDGLIFVSKTTAARKNPGR